MTGLTTIGCVLETHRAPIVYLRVVGLRELTELEACLRTPWAIRVVPIAKLAPRTVALDLNVSEYNVGVFHNVNKITISSGWSKLSAYGVSELV